ncbi:hypothetical protein TWF173_006225 [Orbilia oligospora]|nr:hypothetical protein TWF173_006225 [Orbilia oligospora]
MYLSNLAPELLLNIISSLDANDLAQLRPYMRGWNYGSARGGSMMFAVTFTIIDVEPGSKPRVSTLGPASRAIFDALADQITKRHKKIVDGKFRVGNEILDCDSTGSILRALNKYSHFHPASEFSITSLSTGFSLSQHDLSTFFDIRKLTKLSLRFFPTFWEYDYSMGFPNSETSQHAHFALNEKLLRDIKNLRNLLLKASNLEVLSLRPHVSFIRVVQPLSVLPPALDELGQAVEGLTKLETLKISEYLFHPAFFLPVPKTVKKLQYKKVNKLSQEWWSRFAKAPLTNVESLSIRLDDIGLCPRGVFRESGKGFNIEDIEIKSLKRFICQGVGNPCLPKDLVECINRSNTELVQSISF